MSKTINVSIRVIAMFMGAILLSYIPVLMPKFFGDWYCQGKWIISTDQNGFNQYLGCDTGEGRHNAEWHWGYQHWLFFFMGLCLMIIQIVDIINLINKNENEQ